jgi:hypothetical protein
MVTTALVEKNIRDGEELIKALDRSKLEVKAALWFYNVETDIWRLIIASPYVDKQGPKEAYRLVQTELGKLSSLDIALDEISMVGNKNDLIELLRKAVHVDGIGKIRFRRNAIQSMFIEDALIYRMKK